jgi:AraC-like DNA-binding protein
MDPFTISAPIGSSYVFSHEIPQNTCFDKIAGADGYYISGPFGNMIFQEIRGMGLSAWYSQYLLNCPLTCRGEAKGPVIELYNMVTGYFDCDWKGIGRAVEKTKEGGMAYNWQVETKADFVSAGNYATFDFHFEKDFLIPYGNAYPKIDQLMNCAEKREAHRIDSTIRLDTDLQVILNQLKRFSGAGALRPRYLTLKAEEFLINACEQMHAEKRKKIAAVSGSLAGKAEEIEFIIRKKCCDPMSLAELAKMVASNVHYIGEAFKLRYGVTIFHYIRELRLEQAKQMLLDYPSMSLEAVAMETNYYDGTRFVKVFKKKYGITPDNFRKAGRIK